jgi:hypothetical protein
MAPERIVDSFLKLTPPGAHCSGKVCCRVIAVRRGVRAVQSRRRQPQHAGRLLSGHWTAMRGVATHPPTRSTQRPCAKS